MFAYKMNQRICDHQQNIINLLLPPSYLLLCDLKCPISCDWIVTGIDKSNRLIWYLNCLFGNMCDTLRMR